MANIRKTRADRKLVVILVSVLFALVSACQSNRERTAQRPPDTTPARARRSTPNPPLASPSPDRFPGSPARATTVPRVGSVVTADMLDLTAFRGRTLAVLAISSRGCVSCVPAIRSLESVAQQRPDVLALVLDLAPGQDESGLLELQNALGVEHLVWVVDPDGKLARELELATVDQLLVLDPNGAVTYRGSALVNQERWVPLLTGRSPAIPSPPGPASGCCSERAGRIRTR
ncbi:hypothetical protein OO015_12765 [Thermomicrobium sp. 4228-Ro]|uniref:TlpA family protein disulfide reductase n=1 Tax=Thermomicrobium sp. 4228-Ro TaxID=2993937 RepID=UPI0022491252|nr:hypothetical protein [Thermomicrobium sp. 4228-Ro]MCX2728363.1 hypothetical protein [Thermomicrobium sp. 4228-Ro]